MIKTISLTIDGKKIFADEGTTILEAARQNGITIPTLCYHPRLEPLGHCRICIVKISGMERPVTSCDNPVKEEMIVTTDTPELQEMRCKILELSLATHPYKDCLTCVRTGTCELQESAYRFQSNLPDQIPRDIPAGTFSDNPYIVRDEEKCILCGRCLQICRTGPGAFVYSLTGNGVNTRVIPCRDGKEVTMEEAGCVMCGQCVDVCPVAALTEKTRSAGGREWELSCVPGICTECSVGCYLERQLSGDDMIRVTVPREGDSVSWLCKRGKFGFIREDAAKLITAVMKFKTDGSGYEEVTYDQAIRKAADVLLKIKEDFGPDALAVLGSGKLSSEEIYLAQKFARTVLGTANIDLGAEPAWVKAFTGMQDITGTGIACPTPYALSNAETILVLGREIDESHPVAAMAVDHSGRFGDAVIIRPAETERENSAWKEIIYTTENNGEFAFMEALVALQNGDEETGPVSLSGISDDNLRAAAKLLSGPNSYIVAGSSFFESASDQSVDMLLKLAVTGGQIEQGCSNLLLLSKYSNAVGVLAAGGTPFYGPGFAVLNGASGMAREDILAAAESGKVKGLLSFGKVYADQKKAGIEFLAAVCGDEEEIPGGADLIFPAQDIISKEGLFTNSSAQTRLNKAALPTGENLTPDWRFILDLADAMGARWSYNSLEDVREEMKGLV